MVTSYNGYTASPNPHDFGGLDNRCIPGTDVKLSPGLRKGAVADVLFYVAGQLNKRVEKASLYAKGDDYGYCYRKNRNADNTSCHASGTAFDYNAVRHPNNVARTRNFNQSEITEIHQILHEVDDVVRWGGDFKHTVDAMHFEICAPLDKVQHVAGQLKDQGMLAPEQVVNGDGKVTIAGKVYADITTVSPRIINEAKQSGKMSRHVFRMQVWLRNLGYWPKDGVRRLDGRWARNNPDRSADVLQAAVDKFRRDHRQELGIHDDKGATGTVGEQSLALMRKLNKTQNYPIRQDA